ncbi:RHS repeat-associated core domain-containing protein [Enterobacter mori]|uniref:RHS repeat-associated core domain-containing protein n=1 Tax=Enterobacter mori TaxID=539813 RepID=UPI0028BDC916|nr:RHS repeat-associated core domain-containing protein [Enterobacter mori]
MDTAGKTLWLAQRLAWANLRDETLLAHLPGQYEDRETGLFYNLHRYYDPRHGRYITPNPVGLAGGLNEYAYAGGDPVGCVDPLGLSPFDKNGFENTDRPDFYVGPDGPEATLLRLGIDICDIWMMKEV